LPSAALAQEGHSPPMRQNIIDLTVSKLYGKPAVTLGNILPKNQQSKNGI